jgi:hypothetical protein
MVICMIASAPLTFDEMTRVPFVKEQEDDPELPGLQTTIRFTDY